MLFQLAYEDTETWDNEVQVEKYLSYPLIFSSDKCWNVSGHFVRLTSRGCRCEMSHVMGSVRMKGGGVLRGTRLTPPSWVWAEPSEQQDQRVCLCVWRHFEVDERLLPLFTLSHKPALFTHTVSQFTGFRISACWLCIHHLTVRFALEAGYTHMVFHTLCSPTHLTGATESLFYKSQVETGKSESETLITEIVAS